VSRGSTLSTVTSTGAGAGGAASLPQPAANTMAPHMKMTDPRICNIAAAPSGAWLEMPHDLGPCGDAKLYLKRLPMNRLFT
jgi:hypothetical protein